MSAGDYLQRAGELLTLRGKERDHADGERSMSRTVQSFNAMTGYKLSEEDGWKFMLFLKMARMEGGSYRSDDYEDAVAYAALIAEAAEPAPIAKSAPGSKIPIDPVTREYLGAILGTENITDNIVMDGITHKPVDEFCY